ncbi:MAG: SUMF1/EgtB/PvdO family nonheme iron enzyme [Candidatus Xenobiia bacterium LiM19]
MKDYYKILGIEPSADAADISSAYRALVRKYHPDTYKGIDAENKMKKINEAYAVLNNTLSRADFDLLRAEAITAAQPSGTDGEAETRLCPHCDERIAVSSSLCVFCGNVPDGDARLTKVIADDMMLISAGEFLMGSTDREGNDDEHPQHVVYLDSYYICRYQVTNRQFAQFIRDTGYDAGNNWKEYVKAEEENHPVVNVSWIDAMAYCRWAGGSLPTEAQWEKAARGTDGRIYPWGNTWDASLCHMNSRGTTVVGAYPDGASPAGVLDMAGNVWEWCSDCYSVHYYRSSPLKNPEGPVSGKWRVIKGGSWGQKTASHFRCANRKWQYPDFRNHSIGFRLCGRRT